jgi:hypothetical protein
MLIATSDEINKNITIANTEEIRLFVKCRLAKCRLPKEVEQDMVFEYSLTKLTRVLT